MKVFLMYMDHDFNLEKVLSPPNEKDLTQDLDLNVLLDAMAGRDKFLNEVARKVLLSRLVDPHEILYRQAILKDCLENSDIVRDFYRIADEAIAGQRDLWGWYRVSDSPDRILGSTVRVLQLLSNKLGELRALADEHAGKFESEGFKRLLGMLKSELSDEYLESIQGHLGELEFRKGTLVSARLTEGNKGTDYTLHKRPKSGGWVQRVLTGSHARQYSYTIDDRDEFGPRMLAEMRERGMNTVANVLAQSSDHIKGFFKTLKLELAFYIGCLNLYVRLAQIGEQTCFPVPLPAGTSKLSFVGLYDPCLALRLSRKVVGNDSDANSKNLLVITGANRGGKTTYLRSVGLAQMLLQCGSFVPAESYSADLSSGIFTHFPREEDPTMKSGKLDEELMRMSQTVDHLSSGCMVLLNESFSSTNEREGSEIARELVEALVERGIKVLFVTHLFDFAVSLYEKDGRSALFLRAERNPDGQRTFRIIPGEPLQTSYGGDLYNRVFLQHGLGDPAPKPGTPPS